MTILWPSYVYNGNPHIWKEVFLMLPSISLTRKYIRIPVTKIRLSQDRVFFIMEIIIPEKMLPPCCPPSAWHGTWQEHYQVVSPVTVRDTIMAALDYFTVSLHSPNDRHLPAAGAVQGDRQWPLKSVGNCHRTCKPTSHCYWCNPKLNLDQPVIPAHWRSYLSLQEFPMLPI